MNIPRSMLLVALLAGCAGGEPPSSGAETGPSAGSAGGDATASRLTLDDIADATVAGIYDEPIRLADGRYEGPPFQPGAATRPTVHLSRRLIARADFDGDGEDETAALLEESSGGTGRFSYLGVFERQGDGVSTVAVARLGDRIQVRTLSSEGGQFLVDAIAGGPSDAACCPTMKTVYRADMDAGEMRVTSEQQGPVGLADLAGTVWTLERFASDEAPIEGVRATLRVDPQGSISGNAGCNDYSGSVTSEPERKSFEVGPLAVTRRMCPPPQMTVEDRFLTALGAVTGYSWSQGQLQLAYTSDGDYTALFFDPES